jgi:hypothetical protein
MSELAASLIWTGGVLGGIAMVCFSALKAWSGWLALRREQMALAKPAEEAAESQTGARIEMAHVRERLRKLEAIARGVDL